MQSVAKLCPSPEPEQPSRPSLAHDLNNKIGTILARCELLGSRSRLEGKAAADLKIIRKTAEALADLVGKLEESSDSAGRTCEHQQ